MGCSDRTLVGGLMKKAALLLLSLFPILGFSQTIFERKTSPSGQLGVQVNQFLASGKGERANEEYYFNTLLYYRSRYIITEDEVLGTLTGRITKEEPLSSLSFIQLESIRNPQASYSNLLQSYPQYSNALNNYDLFVRIFEESLKKAASGQNPQTTNGSYLDESAYPLYDDFEEYQPAPAEEQAAPTEYQPAPTAENALSLLYQKPRAVFQQAAAGMTIPVPSMPIPPLEEVLKDSTKSLSAAELEFLIRYEELSRAYSNTVVEYQKVLSARRLLDAKPLFDPADPKEKFRILISSGDDNGLVWIKDFSLDGENNYQSYDKSMWFLRYEIPLTKKDVRLLSNIYLKSKTVAFQVMGQGGMVQIPLLPGQSAAFKKLFEDYVFGKMIQPELDTEISPLLR